MGGDMASLATEAMPYVAAAVGAYGGAVLAKARDEAADATVSLGRRLLHRIFGSRDAIEPLPDPLAALVADPDDNDVQATVRLAICRALASDFRVEAEVRSMFFHPRGLTQHPRAGRDAYTAGGDQMIVNFVSSEGQSPKPEALRRRGWGGTSRRVIRLSQAGRGCWPLFGIGCCRGTGR